MTTPKQQAARVTRTVRDYRRRLIAQEREAQAALAASYDASYDRLLRELTDAIEGAQRAEAAGRPVNTFRIQRALELTRQAEAELTEIARTTGQTLTQSRKAAADLAMQAAGDLLDAHMGAPPPNLPNASSFMTLPRGAIATLTGSLSSGPVAELLGRYGAEAATQAARLLTGAVVAGTHPDSVARQLQRVFDTSYYQAARIARTEINRTYREALRETWAANPELTPEWEWVSGQNSRTCAVCWALDGKRFPSDQPMGTHPNCRCSLSPVSIGWNDLAAKYGVEMPPGDWDIPARPTGPEVFATLPAADQLKVLGPGKYRAYREGAIELRDLVQTSWSDDWGTTRREGSLDRARRRAARR